MDENKQSHGNQLHGLHERISILTARLQSEANKVSTQHEAELSVLISECNKALDQLSQLFDDRLHQIEDRYHLEIKTIEDELSYLRELSEAQRVMLQDSVDYIKELEQRYIKPPSAGA